MRTDIRRRTILATLAAVAALYGDRACSQDVPEKHEPGATAASRDDVKSLVELVRTLQSQVETLNVRVRSLEAKEEQAVNQAQSLRRERQASKSQTNKTKAINGGGAEPNDDSNEIVSVSASACASASSNPSPLTAESMTATPASQTQRMDSEDRVSHLEEDLALANSKIAEQSQSKVESGSKYRLRLTGLALFNLFENRGVVDNLDVPQVATRPGVLDSAGTFGGSLRQSQIGLEGFGPEIAGARTSAEIQFDFGGGFTHAPNGNLMGLARLRTGTVRLDWANTSIVAGQDYLFFSPLTPTSYSSLAIPALSYSGNLWGWTPQVRAEHRMHISDDSTIVLEGGILETLSGDAPGFTYERGATWGERSAQPGYAGRFAWSRSGWGGNIVAGVGGYYGRQDWGFSRDVNSWATTGDLSLPLGRFVELAGQFYRGRAVGGLGGGIGQSVLWNGQLFDPATEVYGLNSMGGWMQVKLKPTVKFEVNGAVGEDNPFAGDLRRFSGNPIYANGLFSRNLTSFANLIYRPRSDVVFSLEYRRLKTFLLDSNANSANHINLSMGYIF